jgi:hypothetical protein
MTSGISVSLSAANFIREHNSGDNAAMKFSSRYLKSSQVSLEPLNVGFAGESALTKSPSEIETPAAPDPPNGLPTANAAGPNGDDDGLAEDAADAA